MAFPTTGVLDAFTDTNGVDLPAHSASWVAPPAGAVNLEVQSNQATGTTAGYCLNYRSTNYGPSSEAYVTVVTPPATSGIATVGVRYANETSFATLDGYNLTLTVAAGTDTLTIQRIDNGVSTALGAAISQEVSAGDAFGLYANGSTLQAYYKASGGSWGQVGTDRTDSTYSAAGKIALLCTGTTVRFDDFGGGSATQALTPSLVTNTQTFHAATVGRGSVSLAPSLVTNSQTFYGSTVSSSYPLTPGLVTNGQTFYAPTVGVGAVTLEPSLLTNGQTFYSPTVSLASGPQELLPSLVTNSQTFYNPTLSSSYALLPSLVTNTQTFYAATVGGRYVLHPSLVTNTQTFYAPAVSVGAVTLLPPLVTNEQTFYAPTVLQQSNQELLPSLLTNEQVFFAALVELESQRNGGDDAYHHTGWNKKAWKKKQKREEAIEETIRETYQKMMGIAPSVEVVESVAQEVKKESPPAAQKPATFDYSGVAEWLQAQETIIAQIIAKRQEDEEDDEEAILLLL